MDRCESCRLVYEEVELGDVPRILRDQPDGYARALERAGQTGVLRERPEPGTWSALEYACHVRDVLRIQRERLQLALEVDTPTFAPMRRDERAVEERYNEQDPDLVLRRLTDRSRRLAAAFERLEADDWRRTGLYGWPEPAEQDMAWLARHTVHETVHHLADIDAGVDRLAG